MLPARNEALSHYIQDVLLIPNARFSVSTSTDPALINLDYPYFKINFNVDE